MGSRDRNGYLAGDCDVGLGLKMQNQNQQQVEDDGFAGGGSFAATMMTMGNSTSQSQVAAMAPPLPIYDVFVTTPPAAASASSYGINDQQRPSFAHPFSLKALGSLVQDTGPTTAAPQATFTTSQRQELERQTIIYKLITASVPVPSELVFPKSNPIFPAAHHHHLINGYSGAISGRNNNNRIGGSRNGNGDAEPWRCRRTDGKKWRCSRDVAPDQKYCERHSHKGRPSSRSRKHVESSFSTTAAATTRSSSSSHSQSSPYSRPDLASATVLSTSSASDRITTTSSSFNFMKSPIYDNRQKTTSFLEQNSSLVLPNHSQQLQYHHHHPYQYNNTSRFPEWCMEKEGHHDTHIDDATAVAMIAPLTDSSHLDHMGPRAASNPISRHATDQTSCPLPRQFLDGWSSVGVEKSSNGGGTTIQETPAKSYGANLLTLSMGGMDSCNGEDAHLGEIGLLEPERSYGNSSGADNGAGGRGGSNDGYSWMNPSQPGGPLAEALCLGIAGGSGSSSGPTTATTPTSSSCSR